MDIQTALVTIAVCITFSVAVAAFSVRMLLKKIENAPDEKTVQNMVTVSSLQIEQKLQAEIQTTRHELRHEMMNLMLPINVKIEETGKKLTELLINMGQVQASLSFLPRRKSDFQDSHGE